jgi:hypothetical protein
MSKGFHIQTLSTTLLVLLLMVGGGLLFGQHKVTIGQQVRCENSEVLIPVDVSEFNNVAAFTFFIQIDTLATEFVAVENPHALLSGGTVIANFVEATSTIIITWASIAGTSIESGKLLDLQLTYYEGIADLMFDESCELASPDGSIIEDVAYENGVLIAALQISGQPQALTVTEGEDAQFGIELQNPDGHAWQWQQNNGEEWIDLAEEYPYTGVNTYLLTIDSTPLAFNGFAYRCMVAYDNCSRASDSATLTVSPLTIVSMPQTGKPLLSIFPNPFDGVLNYAVSSEPGNDYRFQIYNSLGEEVANFRLQQSEGSIYLPELMPGIYFLQLTGKPYVREIVKLNKH